MQRPKSSTRSVAETAVPLLEERLTVSKRRHRTGTVRVATVTRHREHIVNIDVVQQTADVQRVPIGRFVERAPSPHIEGAVTIIPIVEEVVVLEKKLLLREEIHVHLRQTATTETRTVQLRRQHAVIDRRPATVSAKADEAASDDTAAPDAAPDMAVPGLPATEPT